MHRTLAIVTALGFGLGCSGLASAVMCYRIIDRNDNLVYQDTFPPVDLSDNGASQRDQMRARGQHMIASDTEKCPTLEFFTGNAGNTSLSIDKVVAGMNAPNMISAAPGAPTRVPSGTRSSPAAAPPAKPPPAKY